MLSMTWTTEFYPAVLRSVQTTPCCAAACLLGRLPVLNSRELSTATDHLFLAVNYYCCEKYTLLNLVFESSLNLTAVSLQPLHPIMFLCARLNNLMPSEIFPCRESMESSFLLLNRLLAPSLAPMNVLHFSQHPCVCNLSPLQFSTVPYKCRWSKQKQHIPVMLLPLWTT